MIVLSIQAEAEVIYRAWGQIVKVCLWGGVEAISSRQLFEYTYFTSLS